MADGGEVLPEVEQVNEGRDVRQGGARQGQGAPRIDGESNKQQEAQEVPAEGNNRRRWTSGGRRAMPRKRGGVAARFKKAVWGTA